MNSRQNDPNEEGQETVKKTELQQGDVEQLATGFQFVEGPVWHSDGFWYFSDIPANRIHTVTPAGEVGIFRDPSGNSNGLTLDGQGRLLACEHGNRRVSISGADGSPQTLVDSFQGKRLNSPNDLVVHSSGAVYFTDPPYGIKPEEQEQPANGVYRLAADGAMDLLVDDFERPNGLAFSPDESVLYIDDSQHAHVRAFDVKGDGSLENGRLFADLACDESGVPDGLKVDQAGNVFVTNALGMWVYQASGEFSGLIEVPEAPANCAWGEDGKTLFMTARTSVYRVRVAVAGVAVRP
ncbi:MAG: SMP-30/gluconolactonase/LRE family protein [Candidatus Latescibacteria bacterium]|nr:SMP-30/gluconolactonase/LRE family protein [Candidatus Latescibacterota bacterium]